MKASIDFEESIRRKRLIYQGSSRQKLLLRLQDSIPSILALVASGWLFFSVWQHGSRSLLLPAALPAILVLISFSLHNRLARVDGKGTMIDKHAIIRHLLRRYPGIIRHNSSEQIIIITDTSRLLIFKKTYLILQDGSDVYLHLSLSARGKLKYILFPIPLYFMSRAILHSFVNRSGSSLR